MKRIPRPSPAMIVALIAVAIGLGGVAFATIPDSSGTIHGCYNKNSGNLRVVDLPGSCRANERAISWNQEGPPGPGAVTPLGDNTLAQGESKVLFSEGPLTLTARCRTVILNFNAGAAPVAYVVVSTTQDHTAFSGGYSQGREGELQAGPPPDPTPFQEPPGTLRPAYVSGSPTERVFHAHDFSVAAPDGTRLSGVLNVGVNAVGRPGKCVFGGHVVVG